MSSKRPLRLGAIDMGTNSFHLVVAEVKEEGGFNVIEKQREQVALSEGQGESATLSKDALARALQTMAQFRKACDVLSVDEIRCVATSAVREAPNGVTLCKSVKSETGIHVRVISGAEEARLVYLGARPHIDFSTGPAFLVDLGGGSTELIDAGPTEARWMSSLPVGHLRAYEQFDHTLPQKPASVHAIRQWVREHLVDHFGEHKLLPNTQIVGTSGTIRCLGRIATLARGGAVDEADHGLVLNRDDLEKFLRQSQKWSPKRLQKLAGLDARRLHTLPGGAAITLEILDFVGADSITTSAYSLRDGIVWDWIARRQPELDRTRLEPDPRRRSVMQVMSRYNIDERHANHVRNLALTLFDATQPIHKLGRKDRKILEFSALLHDVGHHISGDDHHKHGQYLIRNTRMSGFTAREVEIMAFVARFHRGKPPKARAIESLEAGDRYRATTTCALVAMADAMDRGHDQNVRSLQAHIDERGIHISAQASNAPHLEQWSSLRRARLMTRLLKTPVHVDVTKEV